MNKTVGLSCLHLVDCLSFYFKLVEWFNEIISPLGLTETRKLLQKSINNALCSLAGINELIPIPQKIRASRDGSTKIVIFLVQRKSSDFARAYVCGR